MNFFREEPAPYFASDEEHFLFGSVGTEAQQGIPYWIWLVLPRVFPEYLPRPGGYASTRIAVAGRPRDADRPVEGHGRLPARRHQLRDVPHRELPRAARRSADDLSGGAVAPDRAAAVPPVPLRVRVGSAVHGRHDAWPRSRRTTSCRCSTRCSTASSIIPQTQHGAAAAAAISDVVDAAQSGLGPRPHRSVQPGEVRASLKQPVDTTIGNSDMVPLWNLKQHAGYAYHWDGLNTICRRSCCRRRSATAPRRSGSTAITQQVERHRRRRRCRACAAIENYIENVQAPKYPFAIDRPLAATGATVYSDALRVVPRTGRRAHRHDHSGSRRSAPTAIAWTCGRRLRRPPTTPTATGHAWKFSHFRTTNGYVSVPLEGLWLRAPYLHNGSVPSLTACSRKRRAAAGDVLARVRRLRSGARRLRDERARCRTRRHVLRRTRPPGNSNAGHTYGTDLSADDKRALIEYLKTL